MNRPQEGCSERWAATVIQLLPQTALLTDLDLIQREEEKARNNRKLVFDRKEYEGQTQIMNTGNKTVLGSVKVKNIRCNSTDETLLPLLLTIFIYVAII